MKEADKNRQERIKLKQKYGVAYQRLNEILFAEDPAGVNYETNTDEYEPEVSAILLHLHNCKSVNDVNQVVREVFLKWFDGGATFPGRYPKVADRIWKEVIPGLDK
jgi:hypothetical protein